MTIPSKLNKYAGIFAFILIILISICFVSVYFHIFISPYQISNYTGIVISTNTNHSLSYISYYYNMTLKSNTNATTPSTVNISTLYNIATNLPIPDYSQILSSSLLIATALLAVYGLFALELYKRYEVIATNRQPSKLGKNISSISLAMMLIVPIFVFLYSIFILFDGMLVFSLLQSLRAYLLSTMYAHVPITNIVKSIEINMAQLAYYVKHGIQFIEGGMIFSLFMPLFTFLIYLSADDEIDKYSNDLNKWLNEHQKLRITIFLVLLALLILAIYFIFAST